MGHAPPKASGPPPTRESFHIGNAKMAYVDNRLTLAEFEAAVTHVLRGGHLTNECRIPASETWVDAWYDIWAMMTK